MIQSNVYLSQVPRAERTEAARGAQPRSGEHRTGEYGRAWAKRTLDYLQTNTLWSKGEGVSFSPLTL